MFKLKYIFIIISYLLISSCKKEKNFIVIENVNLFDGENYFENVNIIIDSNKIYDITTDKNWSKQSIIINGKNKTIIPPLINAHVHCWNPSQLFQAMNSGVFALMDMHTTDESANNLRKYRDSLSYAFYYASGPGATVPRGHGTEYGIAVPTIDSSTSSSKFVEDRMKNNADYIKILFEPSMPNINFDQTLEVINTAHKNSKLCVAHVSNAGDALKLNSQKIDGFAHIWFDRNITAQELDSLSGHKIFVIPTLYVTKELVEKNITEKWNLSTLPFKKILEETKKLYDSGIPILAGTDSPNFNFNYGSDLFTELELLHQAGIPALDVLKSATSNIYKSFKLKEFGKLEKGAVADFNLVNGTPMTNFKDISKVESVWRNGRQIVYQGRSLN